MLEPSRRQILIGATAAAVALPLGARALEPLLSGNLGDHNDLTVRGAESFKEVADLLDGAQPISCGRAYCSADLIEAFGEGYLARVAALPAIFDEASERLLDCVSLTLACELGPDSREHQRMLVSYRVEGGVEREIASDPIMAGVDLDEVVRGLARQASVNLSAAV